MHMPMTVVRKRDIETVSGTWVRVGYDPSTSTVRYGHPFQGAARDVVSGAIRSGGVVTLVREMGSAHALYHVALPIGSGRADRYYVGPLTISTS
jgi:hypothetical protein